MKNNNFIIGISIITLATLIISLSNSNQVDILGDALINLEAELARRDLLPSDDNVMQLSDLVLLVIHSELHPDSMRFIMDFIQIHIANLPTVDEIQNLIDVLKQLESQLAKGDSSFNNMGDFLSKYGKGCGPGLDGGASGAAIIPDNPK